LARATGLTDNAVKLIGTAEDMVQQQIANGERLQSMAIELGEAKYQLEGIKSKMEKLRTSLKK
jgi:hypothetical protein